MKLKSLIFSLVIWTIAVIFFLKPSPALAQNCDVNPPPDGDGAVDATDIQAISNHKFFPFDPLYDINGDGTITNDDALLCSQELAPLPPIASPILPGQDQAPELGSLSSKGFTPENIVAKLVSDIIPIVLGIAGFLTVIFIIISGIQFTTSSGNPEAAAAARGRLTFALIGFIIIILAFAITQLVDTIFLGGSGVL